MEYKKAPLETANEDSPLVKVIMEIDESPVFWFGDRLWVPSSPVALICGLIDKLDVIYRHIYDI